MAAQLFKRTAFNAQKFALANNIKKINFKPVKSIELTFDPFSEGAAGVRELSFHFTNPKHRKTNFDCSIRTKVVCDRSEPSIRVKLGKKLNAGYFSKRVITENGREILYKATHLTSLEILEHFNKTCESLLKPPEQI